MENYIALIGAYERDNFGDILFLHVNRNLLSPWPLLPLALVSADMTSEGGGYITSASSWFDVAHEFLPHAVLIAGGEVLTCDLHSAVAFTISDAQADSYTRLRATDKDLIANEIGWRSTGLPYAGTSSLCDGGRLDEIFFAYNSIGGTQLAASTESAYPAELAASLGRASYVSVRDNVTHAALREQVGVNAEIHPDVVNVISLCCDKQVNAGYQMIHQDIRNLNGNYLVFQASRRYLSTNSLTEIANQLASCASRLNSNIVIQPAGLAFEHDTIESLCSLKADLVKLKDQYHFEVHLQENRDVWSQVATITRSRCFIGTSLHGRIVASSYSIPRVSLENKKVSAYAESWDGSIQPFDVKSFQIAECVLRAVNTETETLRAHAEDMSNRVLAGYTKLKIALGIYDHPSDAEVIQEQLEEFRTKAIYNENKKLRNSTVKIGCMLANANKVSREAEYSLESIKSSWSWRLTTPLRSAKKIAAKRNPS